MKLGPALLTRLENLAQTLGLIIRYEKGNFKGGYCILENQRLVVINKFYPVETRCNTLIEVIQHFRNQIATDILTTEQNKLLEKILNQTAELP